MGKREVPMLRPPRVRKLAPRGGEGDEAMVQLATVVPRGLVTRIKCQAITQDVTMRELITDYLEAQLKAVRA